MKRAAGEREASSGAARGGDGFPIVGIGASAGGLQALQDFLSALSEGFGFALVFVQHLSPASESILADLLRSRWPDLEVREIADGDAVQAGHLHVSPPRVEVRIDGGCFQVRPAQPEGLLLPVDTFLTSLAREAGDRAIAVILSGAGSDGAHGVQAVHERGGTVFAQAPETAEFTSMPLAAIATGQVDAILAPTDIAREIQKIHGAEAAPEDVDAFLTPGEFDRLCGLLQDATGQRFHSFKRTVVERRLRRRRSLRGVASTAEYLDLLAHDESEASLLTADLMIGVTSFFRDPAAWKALRTEALPHLLVPRCEGPFRVWCPACATGEEAYSVAMLVHRELEAAGLHRELQVFATDINEGALARARDGSYPAAVASDIPPELVRRYFTASSSGPSLVFSKHLRESVVFARHDVLTDPPFSRVDLVICRNFLIYLEPEAQDRCLTLFHYALKSDGVLFLGNAESAARSAGLFKPLGSASFRLYVKIDGGATRRPPRAVPFAPSQSPPLAPWRGHAPASRPSLTESIQQALLEEYVPAAVALGPTYDILYHNGPTHRYLHQPRGAPTANVLELVPDGLRARLRGALYQAANDGTPSSIRASLPSGDARKRPVTLRISRLKDDVLLVAFRDRGHVARAEEATANAEDAGVHEAAVIQLERELAATRAELQGQLERFRTVNEELQSSNEELQAASEEQETAHEELQSLNEELLTVNAQLQAKIEEQDATNDDLRNLLASTSIPTIFLDRQLCLRRYTPATTCLIQFLASDVGRPILDMSQEALGPDFIADAREVLETGSPIKRECHLDHAWYVRTTVPYFRSDQALDGVVVTYADVTEQKNVEAALRTQAGLLDLSYDAILVRDLRGGRDVITFWNRGATETYGFSPDEALGNVSHTLLRTQFPQDLAEIHEALLHDGHWEGELVHTRRRGDHIVVSSRWALQRDPSGLGVEILETNRDITERKAAEALTRHLASFPQHNPNPLIEVSRAGDITYSNPATRKVLSEMGAPEEAVHLLLPADLPDLVASLANPANDPVLREVEVRDRVFLETVCFMSQFDVVRIYAQDITQRKRAEREREVAVQFLRLLNNSATTHSLIHTAADFIQQVSGCEAAGIRLHDGEDFPYWETRGFPAEFVEAENRLCARDAAGNPLLDSEGNPVLECMCGTVIRGHTDADKPFFTAGGSFWTNSTTRLLACTTDVDRQGRTRNRCHGQGYESVALVPLQAGGERLGLLQLNDRRQGLFSPERVALWERLGGYLAIALGRSRALEALAESETRLRLFVDHAPAALAMFDRDMRYLFASRRWLDDFQLGDRDLTGLSHYRVFPEIGEGWREVHRRALAGEVVRNDADHFVRADGTAHWIRWEVRPWHDATGAIGGIVIFSEDLTNLVGAHEAISSLNQELATRNQELESLYREMESFVYSISHDLRAPLRAISGYATFLDEEHAGGLDDLGRSYVARIRGNTEKMAALIDGLLALARVSRRVLEPEQVDMSALATATLAHLAETHPTRRVQVSVEPGLTATGDPWLMELTLGHLLDNAWKFTPRSDAAHIAFGALEDQGRRVFFVRDNGVGFDAARADKIFAPFQRLHSDPDFEGTGIGLTLVERAIRRQGGRIWAEGALGKGAVVYFTTE